ncbi:MAG: MFS transporter [bacterium]
MLKNQKNIHLKLNALGHAYNDAYHFIIPLLLPFFRQEFLFTYFQSGLILTLHVALRSIFSMAFGSLTDRYNHKHLFIAFGFALSSFLLGSVIFINNPYFMIITLLLMAIGVSTFHPLATAMVGEKAKPNKRGRDLSFFSAAGTLGLTIMSLMFGWLVQISGWRMTCLFISLPGFLLAWGYTQLNNEVPEHDNQPRSLTDRSIFIIFFTGHGFRNLGTWAILSFLPTYATDYIGLNPGISAWIVSIFFAGVLSGSIAISQILDRKNPIKFVTSATIISALLILILTYSTMPIIMALLVACIGLAQGFYFPAHNTWLIKVSSTQTRGKLFGFAIFIEGISATIAPSLYGWLADQFGLVLSYRLASIPIFISFLLYIILYGMQRLRID